MKKILQKFFGNSKKTVEKDRFSDFFLKSSPQEQERILKQAIRGANEDQRALVAKYDQLHPKATN